MRTTLVLVTYVTVITVLFSSCGNAAEEEKAAINHPEFSNPIMLHLAADASQRAQELRMMNGIDAYRTGYSIYYPPTRYSPCRDDASSVWANQYGTKVDGYDFRPEVLGSWLVKIGIYSLESYTIQYPNAPGSAPITFYCPVVTENARRYVSQGTDIHRGVAIPLARRTFKAWTYRNHYETPMPGKGNVKVFAGTFTYTMASLVPGASFSENGSATIKVVLDPDTGRWTAIGYQSKDPSMTLGSATRFDAHPKSTDVRSDITNAQKPESTDVRSDIANALKQASDKGKYDPWVAIAKVKEIDAAVTDKTAYEEYVVANLMTNFAIQAKDHATATVAINRALATNAVPKKDLPSLLKIAVTLNVEQKNYPQAILAGKRLQQLGVRDAVTETNLAITYYQSGKFTDALKTAKAALDLETANGGKPIEPTLAILKNSQLKTNDHAAALQTEVKLCEISTTEPREQCELARKAMQKN